VCLTGINNAPVLCRGFTSQLFKQHMDNFLQLSAGESMYYGSAQPVTMVTITMPLKPEPLPVQKKRPAGRRPLDETGKVISNLKSTLRLQKIEQKREQRRLARAAATRLKQQLDQERRQRATEAAERQERDRARANRGGNTINLSESVKETAAYQVIFTSADGSRTVKIDHKTQLIVKADKSIEEAIARFMNRKQTNF
jgi:hypothetical protein